MSLAAKLAKTPPPPPVTRKGPPPACDIYGQGSREDYDLVYSLRQPHPKTWKYAQAAVDEALGIPKDKRIHNDKFRFHWNGHCSHWDGVDLP